MLNIKTFGTACKRLATAGVKVNQTAHELGIQAMEHAAEHGDVRPMDTLYQAMQLGRLRAEGFRVWVETYSPIRWNGDGKVGLAKPESKLFTPFDINTATNTPFWNLEAAAERPIKDFSLEALQAMLAKALKKAEALNDDGTITRKDGTVEYQAKPDNVVAIKKWASDARAKLAIAV